MWLVLLLLLFISSFFVPSSSSPQTFEHLTCGNTTDTSPSFASNVNRVTGALSDLISARGWGTFSIVEDSPASSTNVFGLGQCYQYVNVDECRECFDEAREDLKRCVPATSGRIYLDRCFLRFDYYSFYKEGVDAEYDQLICGWRMGVSNDSYMYQDYQRKLDQVLMNVSQIASRNGGFAATEMKGGVITIYALAQCWKTIGEKSCQQCLRDAGVRLRKCAPKAEGRALFSGCFIRYSTNRFFEQEEQTEGNQGN